MQNNDSVFTKTPALKWSFPGSGITAEQIEEEAKRLSVPRFIAAILLSRGIDDAQPFLSKSKKYIRHPNKLPDIEDAVDRILEAVKRKEPVVVYGDYDVDGMTSTAIMTDFLSHIGADVSYYIPDRVSEGYGVNNEAVKNMAEDGVKLIVTVDCGVTNINESLTAFENNVDLVITDHHTCLDELPYAYAVVNPKRPDSEYGFSGLAGVGVAFKVCMAIGLRMGMNSADIFDRYCALAAIGTIADVVPLVDENRVIVAKGLDMISRREFVGIDAILHMIGASKRDIVSSTVSFGIAPKLNAAGRLGDPRDAVTLLMTEDRADAEILARRLDDLNNRRRELENIIYNSIIKDITDHGYELCERTIVICGDGWNHGVIGRVAAMVSERFYRPCIIVSFDEEKGKGSCRSIEGFDMFSALFSCSDLLDDFGGHKAAAGLSITRSNWFEFKRRVSEYGRTVFRDLEDMSKIIHIDCELLPREITLESCFLMNMLEPFGTDNSRPVFITYGLTIESISVVGADGRHVRAMLTDGRNTFAAIGFGLAALERKFRKGNRVDCVYTLEINNYNGIESVQMRLIDMDWSSKLFE